METPGDQSPVTKRPGDQSPVTKGSKAATQGLRSTKSAQSKAYRKEESLPSANQYTKNTPLPEYRSDLALFKALFTWHGTIFPLVACSTAFWALWASHGVFIALKKFNVFMIPDNDDETAEVTWSVITVPTSLMVFFLVFYGGQCYNRFFEMYMHCVGVSGAIMCWTTLVKLHLSGHDPNVQWNCLRHVHAAAHVQYYTLQGADLTENEQNVIQGRDLLTVEETRRVVAYAGFKPLLPIYWALSEVKAVLQADSLTDSSASALRYELRWNEFLSAALKLRAECSMIVNLLKQPVPWAYFHLLNLMTFVTLLLVSYFLAFVNSWVMTTAVHGVICLIVLGLKNLAGAMADPFGDDVIDFKVEKLLAGMYDNSLANITEVYTTCGSGLPDGLRNPLSVVGAVETFSPRMPSVKVSMQRAKDRRATAADEPSASSVEVIQFSSV